VLEANTEVTNRDVSNADFANIHSSTIRIEVSDTGVGIPTEALPRVFDRLPRRFIALPEFRGHGIGIGYRSEYCRASRRRCGDFQPTGTGRTRNTPHAGILIRIFLSEVTKVDEPRRASPAQQGEMKIPPDLLQVADQIGGGAWTRTTDLRIMRPSL
jgi:hypothetical protein